MHEMSIAQSLFEIITGVVEREKLTRVNVVRMRIGEMSAVVPEALEFSFEVLARGTPVEGARLEMTLVPVTGRCASCGTEFPVERHNFSCPGCRSPEVALVGGDELHVDELEGE